MTDKINTIIVALWAGAIAAALQASTVVVKGAPIRWQAMVGTLTISGVFGGFSVVMAIEQFHVAPFVAGAIGAISGIIPAPIVMSRINAYVDARADKAIIAAGGKVPPPESPVVPAAVAAAEKIGQEGPHV